MNQGDRLTVSLKKTARILAIITALYHLYVGCFGMHEPQAHRSLHLGMLLGLAYLARPASKKVANSVPWRLFDVGCACLSFAIGFYRFLHTERIVMRWPFVHPLTTLDFIFGICLIILILEACRRYMGNSLVIVIGAFIAYALLGQHIPGQFWHRGMSIMDFIDQLSTSTVGIYGIPLGASSNYIVLFVIFGLFLSASGAGEFFFKLAKAATQRMVGGGAKVAVVASALFGTISGSPIANVMTTGSFTIPSMKKQGYSPAFAGAVEAAASTGGHIMPPVMGAAAFVMAELTGTSYIQICKSAAIPAIFYFFSVFMGIHFRALRRGMGGVSDPDEHIDSMGHVLKEGWFYSIPLILLVWLLMKGLPAATCALFATVATAAVSWVRKETRMGVPEIIDAMAKGAEAAIGSAVACGAAGIVVGLISSTGLGGKIMSLAFSLAQGRILPALIITMITCLILGMGMPVTPAYVIVSALATPVLIAMGVNVIATHLFAIYFACLSAITPPVAVAAFAAATLAEESPTKIALIASRLAAVAFIVPFMFIYEPALLFQGSLGVIARACVTGVIGIVVFSAGLEGWLVGEVPLVRRILLIGAGLMLIHPGLNTDLLAIPVVLVAAYPDIVQWLAQRRATA